MSSATLIITVKTIAAGPITQLDIIKANDVLAPLPDVLGAALHLLNTHKEDAVCLQVRGLRYDVRRIARDSLGVEIIDAQEAAQS